MHSIKRNSRTVFDKPDAMYLQRKSQYKLASIRRLHLIGICLLLASSCCHLSSACSSRTVPKPRTSISSPSMSAGTLLPPTQAPVVSPITMKAAATTTMRTLTTTTARPNITFATYKCPETFDAWYCLNDAHCFAIKIVDTPVYSCECATGFVGQRCEYKELDGSYLPKRPRPLLEKASIATGAMCALGLMLIVCLVFYWHIEKRDTQKAYEMQQEDECQQNANYEQCDCCYAQCCDSPDLDLDETLLLKSKLPYYMRLEHTLMSFALRHNSKL